jgi:hypothetical protein
MYGPDGWTNHPLDPVERGLRLPQSITTQLTKWRMAWEELWYVELEGTHYVFRTPTRRDIITWDLNSQTNPGIALDHLVSTCTLYPQELKDDMPLRHVNALGQCLIDVSLVGDQIAQTNRILDFQDIIQSGSQDAVAMIVRAFGVTPDEINTWQPDKTAYHTALAMYILGMEPMKDTRPKEARARVRAPQQPRADSYDWEKDRNESRAFESS